MNLKVKLETPVIVALLSLVSAVLVAIVALVNSFCQYTIQYIIAPALAERRKAKEPQAAPPSALAETKPNAGNK